MVIHYAPLRSESPRFTTKRRIYEPYQVYARLPYLLPFTFYHTYIGSVTAAVNRSFASWRLYVKILPYNGGKNGKNRIPG